MKKLLALVIALAMSAYSFALAQAQITFPATGTVSSAANVRSGPGTGNAVVASVSAGQTVTIAACNNDCTWYRIGDNQWIASFLVTVATSPVAANPAPAAPAQATARAASNANLRGGPGTNYLVVGSVIANQSLTIVGRNDSSTWYQLSSGQWIFGTLVSNAPTNAPVVGVPAVLPTTVPAVQPSAPQAAPTAAPAPVPAAPAAQECDPNYAGACIPIVSYDLNCPDVGVKNFRVVGVDRHRFDRDKDGIACES